MKKVKETLTNNVTMYIYGVFFVFVLWYLISLQQGKNSLIFPTPDKTFSQLGDMLSTSYIYKCIGWSLLRTLMGFGISFGSALVIGLLAGSFNKLYLFLKPLIIVLKSAPTAAFVFLFLLLSDSKYAPVYIVIILAFPILYESVVGGIHSITDDINDALKVDSGKFFRPLLKVKLPLSFQYILVGLASSFALSFKTTIMAEIITGDTDYGLGCAISAYRNLSPTDLSPIFAIALVAIIIILIVDLLAFFIKKKISKNI